MIPARLKIGAVVYSVEETDSLHYYPTPDRREELLGRVTYFDARIQLKTESSTEIKVVALLHEAIHAVLHNAGHEYHDEDQVAALGYGLYALLRDNPALVQLIQEQPHHGG